MTELEAIRARHSVRQYLNRPLTPEELTALRAEADACNRESGLHIQLVVNEPKAFEGSMARYGKFSGVQNYFALVGKAGPDLQEKCGYWGERLVLKAQAMGLNTCWVALTFTKVKSAYTLDEGEKLAAVISLGHGATQGVPHKSKKPEDIAAYEGEAPEWFRKGTEALLLAPTALNRQAFSLRGEGRRVAMTCAGGAFSGVELGIGRYHFELGAGKENFDWISPDIE